MPPTKRPQRRPEEGQFRDEEILRADDPRPQRVTQYPVKRSPRKPAEEAIPTSVFDTEKHDEELRASYGADQELGYKPVFLYVERGPGQGQLVQVRQGQLVIGRASVSELRLQHPSISRRHAMVTRIAEQFYVKDLGSQNGTFVNKQRIATEIEIFPGDTVAMGNAVLKLRGPLQKGEGAPPSPKPQSKVVRNKTPLKTAVVMRPKTSSAVKVAIFAGAVGFGLAAVLAIALLKLPTSSATDKAAAAKKAIGDKADEVVVAVDEVKTRIVDEAIKKKMAEAKAAAGPEASDEAAPANAPVPGRQEPATDAPAPARAAPAAKAQSSERPERAEVAATGGGSKRSQVLAAYEKGDPDAALELAQKAGDKDLSDKLSRFINEYDTANEAYVANQGGPAIKHFEAALKLDEQLSGGWSKKGTEIRKQLSKLYTMVGLVHAKNGGDDDAKQAFQAALKFDGSNEQAKVQLQMLGGETPDTDEPAARKPATAKASTKAAADDAFGDEEVRPAAKKPAAAEKKEKPVKSRSQAIDDAFGD